jgi:hypothetical protein
MMIAMLEFFENRGKERRGMRKRDDEQWSKAFTTRLSTKAFDRHGLAAKLSAHNREFAR